MKIPESVNDGRDGPGLSDTGAMTSLPMRVGQLRQALPFILDDMFLVRKQPLHSVLPSLLFGWIVHKDELCLQEEANWPDPLWALMIVESMGVIGVVIITVVLSISWIKRLDAHTSLLH